MSYYYSHTLSLHASLPVSPRVRPGRITAVALSVRRRGLAVHAPHREHGRRSAICRSAKVLRRRAQGPGATSSLSRSSSSSCCCSAAARRGPQTTEVNEIRLFAVALYPERGVCLTSIIRLRRSLTGANIPRHFDRKSAVLGKSVSERV